MNKIIRYRVYGVIDVDGGEGIDDLMQHMREYGSACIIDFEIVKADHRCPLLRLRRLLRKLDT